MNNKISEGKVVQYTAGADIDSGDVVTLGAAWGAVPAVADKPGRIGVAAVDIANGSTGSVVVAGVFRLALKAGDTPAVGDTVFWDATPGEVTVTQASNWPAGMVWALPGGGFIDVLIG